VSGMKTGLTTILAPWLLLALAAHAAVPVASDDDAALTKWAAAPHRSERNVVRDNARHPVEVLTFFGVRPYHTVVEILPGSTGYYMEILAPYLREKGRYIAADRDESAAPQYVADHQRLLQRWTWVSKHSRRLLKKRIEEALHRFERFQFAR